MSKSPLVSPPCGATPVPSRPTYLPPQLHLHARLTAFHILQHPQLLLVHTQLLLEILVSPLLDLEVLLG